MHLFIYIYIKVDSFKFLNALIPIMTLVLEDQILLSLIHSGLCLVSSVNVTLGLIFTVSLSVEVHWGLSGTVFP